MMTFGQSDGSNDEQMAYEYEQRQEREATDYEYEGCDDVDYFQDVPGEPVERRRAKELPVDPFA